MSLCTCPICGAEKKNLTKHVNMLHKLSRTEFLNLYPDTKMVSEETSNLISNSLRSNWKDPEYAQRCSVYARSGRNIGGKSLKGIRKSDDTKYKIKMFANSKRGKEIRSKNLSKTLKTLWKSEDYINTKRELGRIQALNNLSNSEYGHKRYKYNGISFRSSWEVNVATALDNMNIEYKYEKYRFIYKINNIEHIYIPDFYLPKYNIFFEVKPECFINNITDTKLNSVKESGYKIFYLSTNNIKLLQNIIRTCVE